MGMCLYISTMLALTLTASVSSLLIHADQVLLHKVHNLSFGLSYAFLTAAHIIYAYRLWKQRRLKRDINRYPKQPSLHTIPRPFCVTALLLFISKRMFLL